VSAPALDGSDIDDANWLQVKPQYCWHSEALIEGSASALRALANSLLVAANEGEATSEQFFARDGEGYRVEVRRKEKPEYLTEPFYTIQLEVAE
jgi:hypothetical protein